MACSVAAVLHVSAPARTTDMVVDPPQHAMLLAAG